MNFEQVPESTVGESNFEMPQSNENMESFQNRDLNNNIYLEKMSMLKDMNSNSNRVHNLNVEELRDFNDMNNLNDMNDLNDMNNINNMNDLNNMNNLNNMNSNINLNNMMNVPIDEEEVKRLEEREKEEIERRKKIEEKINFELQKKKELREKASEYLNNFMNERSEKIALKKKENENKELENLNNKKLLKEGKLNPWEAVTENIAMKDSEYKGSRDVSRMREVIINRKNDLKDNGNQIS